jgi:hypothetical protein
VRSRHGDDGGQSSGPGYQAEELTDFLVLAHADEGGLHPGDLSLFRLKGFALRSIMSGSPLSRMRPGGPKA